MPSVHEAQEPIAIVSIGCRFPGESNTPSKLWDLLREPRNTATEIPTERFNLDRFYHEDGSHHGTCNVKETYFLDQDIRRFDAGFFGIPPGEASAMDPQHRLLMETVYEAMEASGMTIPELQGSDTAVYVGVMCSDYYILAAQDFNIVPTYNSTGIANSNASARLSYFFDWNGPCMTIDTACSSSLVAVHQAVQVLRAGTSRLAVAAGTNLLLSPLGYISESKLGMLSPSGRCQMWDEKADGYARGEGVACVLLKRLSDAIADGDHIECIIRETGVNQDGRTKGITMPSAESQAALIKDTYARAGLDPTNPKDRCQYFEAHGTGTPAGDPKEAEALDMAFFSGAAKADLTDILHVGSIKTVVGHTEGTAGLAGIIKAYLSIRHGLIPPNLHFDRLSSLVKPFYSHLNVVTEELAWPNLPKGEPRRASVNSFGFGGTNSHAIIESYGTLLDLGAAPSKEIASSAERPYLPFVFSAASEKTLRILVESYAQYLETTLEVDLRKLAYTLSSRRTVLAYKTSISAATQDELLTKLQNMLGEGGTLTIARSTGTYATILGIFTGQGAQWPQMGAEILNSWSYARTIIKELDSSLASLPGADRPSWTLLSEILADSTASRMNEATVAQPVVCAVQILLVNLLRRAGVPFKSVIGHSSGEISAAYAAGFLSQQDAIRIAYYRGFHSYLAVGNDGKQGGMLAVGTSYEDALELCALEDFEGRLTVAASNSPTSVTISGDLDALDELKVILESEEKFVRPLKVDKAYHSFHMKAASVPFVRSLQACRIEALTPPEGSPIWISSVYPGEAVTSGDGLDYQYWTDNLNKPVLFSQALETTLQACGPFDSAIEVGPHPALKGPASDVIKAVIGKELPYIGTLNRGKGDVESFTNALGALWTTAGVSAVDFASFQLAVYDDKNAKEAREILHGLPAYPWDHDRVLWSESRSTKLMRQQEGKFHDILGTRSADGTEEEWRWKNLLHPKELPWVIDHALQGQTVFPGTGYFCLAMEAAMQIAGDSSVQLLELTDLSIRKAIAIDESVGTETLVSMTKIVRTEYEITMAFACFSTLSKDATNLGLNAIGKVRAQLGPTVLDILAPRSAPIHGMQPVEIDHFYTEVGKIGYNYGPTFRGITKLERKLGHSRGDIVGPANNETGTPLLFHPGMLDAALQGMLVGFSSPGDGRLWSLHAPSSIKRVTLVPGLCGMNMTKEVSFDCAVTDVEFNKLTGDVEVFQSDTGYKSICVEGVSFIPFTSATQKNDRHLFAYNRWDIDAPNGELALGSQRATPKEVQKGLDCERVAFYYLKTLHEGILEPERIALNIPVHHQALFDYAEYIYNIVDLDEHAYVKKAWMEDSYEQIVEIMESYGPDPDFLLTAASGENLPAVIRGQTTILEHMTKDNKLENYYQHALGFHELNELIATTVKQISHRYPNMNICEIGAGTGGSSRRILAELGNACASYTYTDISSGFFAKAQENFAAYRDKMIYKTLDVTVDPTEQGFEEGAYDVVVAANVLHATPDLVVTLTNARKLLRPGGYLVMMEFIDDSVMRLGVIIGGLPGWWIGKDSGRKYSPCVSLPDWNDLLIKSGFAGVDTSTPVHDPVVTPASILVAQALDKDMVILREPFAEAAADLTSKTSKLVILGGKENGTQTIITELVDRVKSHYKTIARFNSWEDLDVESIAPGSTILNLSDIDGTFWRDITVDRFEKLKQVLMPAANVMWITWGTDRENSDGAMTVGFFRSLRYELPEAQLQIIDFEKSSSTSASFITEALLRLEVTSQWRKTGSIGRKMWTTESEIKVRDGHTLIPRVLPQKPQNDRYNSAKRAIEKNTDLRESIVTLNWWNELEYALREEEVATLPSAPNHRRVRVDSSILSSMVTVAGRLFFSLGTDMDSGERVLSVSSKNASAILVSKKWSVAVAAGRGIDAQYLSFLSGYILSQQISAMMPRGGTLVVHEADPGLASMISRQLTSLGCELYFTTANTDMVKRNWIALHPCVTDRDLSKALPKNAAMFLSLSSAGSGVEGSKVLSDRIAKMLPALCEKHDASVVIARESTELSGSHDDAIHEMLVKANDFAAKQLNGVPDGMPLRMVPVTTLLNSAVPIDLMSIVHWRESLVPVRVELVSNRNDLFKGDKTYWLVGLAGDLGRSICDFMVAHGARYVVLSSRSAKTNEQWVEDHALQGATVAFMKADITKKSDLEAVHKQITRTMPPVAGVTNGSLVLRDKGLINMDLDTFHVNTKCKVEGTEYLDEMFPDNTLDWFIAFSSISATVGNMGQMAYTAANMFMKAIIAQRRHRGVAGSVIDISQVFGVGYIEREMKLQTQLSREQAIRLMSRSGTLIMSEPDLHQLFAEAIIAGRARSHENPDIITGIKTITPAEAKDALWGNNVRFGHFIQNAGSAKLPSVTKTTSIPVKVQLEAAKDVEEQSSILTKAFVAKLRASLLMDDENISETTPLIDLGVDSLVAVEIRTWFAQEVGVDVAVLKILGGPSVQDLVEDTMVKLAVTVASSKGSTDVENTSSEDAASTDGVEASSESSVGSDNGAEIKTG